MLRQAYATGRINQVETRPLLQQTARPADRCAPPPLQEHRRRAPGRKLTGVNVPPDIVDYLELGPSTPRSDRPALVGSRFSDGVPWKGFARHPQNTLLIVADPLAGREPKGDEARASHAGHTFPID
ncbi:hypothetical protein DPEC_G00369210 [Dallia pectoralis]|nr:hypothetical protein DPEC_G00369210 [Dallia pectoralis]